MNFLFSFYVFFSRSVTFQLFSTILSCNHISLNAFSNLRGRLGEDTKFCILRARNLPCLDVDRNFFKTRPPNSSLNLFKLFALAIHCFVYTRCSTSFGFKLFFFVCFARESDRYTFRNQFVELCNFSSRNNKSQFLALVLRNEIVNVLF